MTQVKGTRLELTQINDLKPNRARSKYAGDHYLPHVHNKLCDGRECILSIGTLNLHRGGRQSWRRNLTIISCIGFGHFTPAMITVLVDTKK